MNILKGCSELHEAAQLFRELSGDPFAETGLPVQGLTPSTGRVRPDKPPTLERTLTPTASASLSRKPAAEEPPPAGAYRADRLAATLAAMCRRGGFSGAVLADTSGLPLAVHDSPVDEDRLAGFTAVLGDALDKAGRFLDRHQAEYISMDVNYEDKAVLRRFSVGENRFLLMVLCPQGLDERSEIEFSVSRLGPIIL